MYVGRKLWDAAVRRHFKAGSFYMAKVVSSEPVGRSDLKEESKLFQAEQISSVVFTKMEKTVRYASSTQSEMW